MTALDALEAMAWFIVIVSVICFTVLLAWILWSAARTLRRSRKRGSRGYWV